MAPLSAVTYSLRPLTSRLPAKTDKGGRAVSGVGVGIQVIESGCGSLFKKKSLIGVGET